MAASTSPFHPWLNMKMSVGGCARTSSITFSLVELVREMDRFDLTRLREGPLSDSAYDLSSRIDR
jgi:hypothetical protein